MIAIAVDDEVLRLGALVAAIKASPDITEIAKFSGCEEALEFVTSNPVDIAFLDINMRGMGGLALAEKILSVCPDCKIVFCTGYEEYAIPAFKLHASGYLLKPVTPEAVRTELENLRHPIEWNDEKRIKIITFGNFDVFVDGTPLKFERKLAKEILAYLVDKRGTSATYTELAAMLWEDEEYDRTKQKNLQVYIASLVKSLHAVEVKDLILKNRQGILVNTKIVDCDYYIFLDGDTRAINSFTGQYMSAYYWAEFTVGYLENQMQKAK